MIQSSLIDESGKYRLAIADMWEAAIAEATNAEEEQQINEAFAALIKTPSGGYRPLPSARRFHKSKARWRFAIGGNRSSKSMALSMETFWAATGTHPWRTFEVPNEGFYATTTWEKVGDTLWAKLKHLLIDVKHEIAWHNKQRDIPEIVFVQPLGHTAR